MSLQGAGVQERAEQNTLHPSLATLTADTTSSASLKEGLVEVISTFFFQALGFRFFANTNFKMRERRRLQNNITEILTKQHLVTGDHWFKPTSTKMCYFAVNCTPYYYPTYCFLLQIMLYIHACSIGRAFIYKYPQADIWHVAIHQKGPQQFYFLDFGATSLLAFFLLYVTGKGLRWEGSHTEKELACNAEEWKHC